jgi:hypothetical protein
LFFDSDVCFIAVPVVGGALIGAGFGVLAKMRIWIAIGAVIGASLGGFVLFVLMAHAFSGGLCH